MNLICKIIGHKFVERFASYSYYKGYIKVSYICLRKFCKHEANKREIENAIKKAYM